MVFERKESTEIWEFWPSMLPITWCSFYTITDPTLLKNLKGCPQFLSKVDNVTASMTCPGKRSLPELVPGVVTVSPCPGGRPSNAPPSFPCLSCLRKPKVTSVFNYKALSDVFHRNVKSLPSPSPPFLLEAPNVNVTDSLITGCELRGTRMLQLQLTWGWRSTGRYNVVQGMEWPWSKWYSHLRIVLRSCLGASQRPCFNRLLHKKGLFGWFSKLILAKMVLKPWAKGHVKSTPFFTNDSAL